MYNAGGLVLGVGLPLLTASPACISSPMPLLLWLRSKLLSDFLESKFAFESSRALTDALFLLSASLCAKRRLFRLPFSEI